MSEKTILCYGDSNTWGYVPTVDYALPRQRYARDKRWPGILQGLLGTGYHVIEEGLNSRTTNIDHVTPPDRNGKTYLLPCLYSHSPIDLVILALGGNDAKTYFNRDAKAIAAGLEDLIQTIQASPYGSTPITPPKILLLAPATPPAYVEKLKDENGIEFLAGSVAKSVELEKLLPALAKQYHCDYLNANNTIKPSPIDGVHYDEAGHAGLAALLKTKVNHLI